MLPSSISPNTNSTITRDETFPGIPAPGFRDYCVSGPLAMTGQGLRRTHNEASVLHAFCAEESIRQPLHISRLAAKDFQAALVVEMDMQGGNDNGMRLVLEIGELLRQ